MGSLNGVISGGGGEGVSRRKAVRKEKGGGLRVGMVEID